MSGIRSNNVLLVGQQPDRTMGVAWTDSAHPDT